MRPSPPFPCVSLELTAAAAGSVRECELSTSQYRSDRDAPSSRGFCVPRSLMETDTELFERHTRVNQLGCFLGMKTVVQLMEQSGALVIPLNAHLVALYAIAPGDPRSPATDDILTIEPPAGRCQRYLPVRVARPISRQYLPLFPNPFPGLHRAVRTLQHGPVQTQAAGPPARSHHQ